MLHLDTATIIGLAISYLIPLLASLLAKATWPAELVGLLTLALSTVNGFLVEWAAHGDGFDWRRAAATAVGSYIVAAVARSQTWRHTQTDAKALALGSKHPRPTP